MRHPRTLRSRLLWWFLGAILMAILTSTLVASQNRPEAVVGAEAVARHLADNLAVAWDDPAAAQRLVDEIRDVTGLEARVVRDPRGLGSRVRRAGRLGAALVAQGPRHIAIPVVRDGAVVGALEIDGFGTRVAAWGWTRLGLTLLLVVTVLSVMAGVVAKQLARPLERLAQAADRFGAGELALRTDLAGGDQRWAAREVRAVAVSFNRMADRVEAMVRGQRELLGAISHELRSPLARARIALEIARDRAPPEADARSCAAALRDVERQLESVDAILGDLLDMTRVGLADLRKERHEFARWIGAQIAQEPQPPAIETAFGPAADPVIVDFDAALLGRALHNLLVNARTHGHPATAPIEVQIEVQVEVGRRSERPADVAPPADGPAWADRNAGSRASPAAGAGWVRVTVRDRGPGLPMGIAERAFEPFVRGDAARARLSDGPGYGLGLAIVRRVVEAHGGRVFARNRTGGPGAEVGFDLPVSALLDEADRTP